MSGRLAAFDVRADSRGVFVATTIDSTSFDPSVPPGPSGHALVHHNGTGWSSWWDTWTVGFPEAAKLQAVPEGPLYLQGPDTCPVWRISEPDQVDCHFGGDVTLGYVTTFHVTPSGDTWYGFASGAIRRQRGDTWDVGPTGLDPVDRLWGDGDRFVGLASRHLLIGELSGSVSTIDLPAGAGCDRLWVSDPAGVILGCYDGSVRRLLDGSFEVVRSPSTGGSVTGFWSRSLAEDDPLYFITENSLGVHEAGSTRALVEFADPMPPNNPVRFVGLWGSVDGDVLFIAVQDDRYEGYECGSSFLVYFDGVSLRRM